jgi:hypothetical protein
MIAIIIFYEDMDSMDLLKELNPIIAASGLDAKSIEIFKSTDNVKYGK